MKAEESLALLLNLLNDAEIPYMVVGSFSSNFHGVPRSTKDADIVADLDSKSWQIIADNLPVELELDSQGFFEMVTATRKELLRVKDSLFEIEIFHLSDDPFDQERFSRRERVALPPTQEAWIATAEDVVIQKLRWAKGGMRQKDFDDVVNVLFRKGSSWTSTTSITGAAFTRPFRFSGRRSPRRADERLSPSCPS